MILIVLTHIQRFVSMVKTVINTDQKLGVSPKIRQEAHNGTASV